MITAGPTYEKLDPVRYIGNYSSGKMGYALAEICAEKGAEVFLVSGPVSLTVQHPSVKVIQVESADEMYKECMDLFGNMDAAILCAAVADYKPEINSPEKIKREENGEMNIRLVRNKDIAAALGQLKQPRQVLAGFALENRNEIQNARSKLEKKNLDFIVLNSLNDKGAGFQTDTNKISVLYKNGIVAQYDLKRKKEVAEDIVSHLCKCLTQKGEIK